MISVQNLQLQSNGSNFWLKLVSFLFLIGMVTSCVPRSQVVKPDGGPVILEPTKPSVEVTEEAQPVREQYEIALMLPFQLNRSTGQNPTSTDLERAELALDFYQGFKLGLEKQTSQGTDFKLEVLDSRDNEEEVRRLVSRSEVKDALLVVGPIFPKEISAFGDAAVLKNSNTLQISPLAATMPTEFNLPNLVSITSPILTHVRALAQRIVEAYQPGDVVLLYESDETSSQQFLNPLKTIILQLNRNIALYEVKSKERLEELVHFDGKNLVVSGSSNRFQVLAMLEQLRLLRDQSGHRFQLFGHPNWAKISFPDESGLQSFQTIISSTYYIDPRQIAVRDFRTWYRDEFTIEPSEFAYKGYDTGMYFGLLLSRHGKDYSKHLVDTEFEGLHNSFQFEYNSKWGFVNQAIHFLRFNDGHFVR